MVNRDREMQFHVFFFLIKTLFPLKANATHTPLLNHCFSVLFCTTNSKNGGAALLLDLQSVRLFSRNNTNGIQMINETSFLEKKTSLASENWRLTRREKTTFEKPPEELSETFLDRL